MGLAFQKFRVPVTYPQPRMGSSRLSGGWGQLQELCRNVVRHFPGYSGQRHIASSPLDSSEAGRARWARGLGGGPPADHRSLRAVLYAFRRKFNRYLRRCMRDHPFLADKRVPCAGKCRSRSLWAGHDPRENNSTPTWCKFCGMGWRALAGVTRQPRLCDGSQ